MEEEVKLGVIDERSLNFQEDERRAELGANTKFLHEWEMLSLECCQSLKDEEVSERAVAI